MKKSAAGILVLRSLSVDGLSSQGSIDTNSR